MQTPLKNIVLDFDGVIADTFDMNWALSQECDETATLEDFLAHHDGNVFAEPRIKFKPDNTFSADYRKRISPSHLERAYAPLRRLSEKHALYVVSSTRDETISEVLELAGLLMHFTRILGSQTHKSKVEKFKILMRENGVTPDDTVFITDTLGDIREAHQVGIRTIAETFGFHDRKRLELGEPFKIVDSWDEIESVIQQLAK